MRCTSPKVHRSKTIHDWHRPLRIVQLFMHLLANAPQWRFRGPILWTIPWSPIYISVYKYACLDAINLFVGPRNRHWGAFAKRCINNRTIRHDAKGAMPIVHCFRKMHLWVSKSHAVCSIPVFYLDGVLIWRRCQKFVSGLIIMGIWRVRRLLMWDLGVVPVIIYHFNAKPVFPLRAKTYKFCLIWVKKNVG